MQNLTAKAKGRECVFCVESPFSSAVLPYVLVSLPANGWVMWLMVSSPVFWTDRMEVSEFHLVFTELLFGFFGSPLLITSIFSGKEVKEMVHKLINTIFIARIQFQTSICIERYLAVVHPVLYLRYKALRYRMSFCCGIWLLTLLLGIVQTFFCTQSQVYIGFYTYSLFIVFVVNSFCSLSVLRALKQPSPGDGEREGSNLIKKRAFNLVLIFQVTTFVSYVPQVTLFLLFNGVEETIVCNLQVLSYSTMVWLGATYSLLYLRRSGKLLVRNVCVNCFRTNNT